MAANSAQTIFDNDDEMVLGMKENDYLRPLNVKVVNLGEIKFAESDIWAKKDITYNIKAKTGHTDHLYFSFMLSGTLFGDCEGLFSTRKFTADYASGWYNPNKGGNVHIPGGQRIRRLFLAISTKFIEERIGRSSDCFPIKLRKAMEDSGRIFWHEPFTLTPWMKTVFAQIANNPHSGELGDIYLESRCLELMIHCLEESCKKNFDYNNIRLNTNDVDKIHYARDILFKNIDDPPSIVSLAKQVGLNETKLKRGFRIVFNATIFGYLRNHRMQQAKELLSKGDMNVSEVAYAVGYTNLSNFSKIFCQSFGVLPRTFLREAKDRATHAVISST